MALPEIEKISRLIDAIRDFVAKDVRAAFEEYRLDTYDAPCLSLWDALQWFELAQDWEIVDFLISGDKEARRLMKSLQALLQWYGQEEINEMQRRRSILSIIN
jgi:hypothetical protein